jgi:hypothetical protein
MGNKHHSQRKDKLCSPIQVNSVTPKKVKTEIGIYHKNGDDIKSASVTANSSAAIWIVFIGGGYLVLNFVSRIFRKSKGWTATKKGFYPEISSEPFGLFGRRYSSTQQQRCLPCKNE